MTISANAARLEEPMHVYRDTAGLYHAFAPYTIGVYDGVNYIPASLVRTVTYDASHGLPFILPATLPLTTDTAWDAYVNTINALAAAEGLSFGAPWNVGSDTLIESSMAPATAAGTELASWVGAGPAGTPGTITLAPILPGFNHLSLRGQLALSASCAVSIQFNTDGGAYYQYTYGPISGTSVGVGSGTAATSAEIASGTSGPLVVDLFAPLYAAASATQQASGHVFDGATVSTVGISYSPAAAAAITSIEIVLSGGAAFVAGTAVYAYGV